jgi:Restriction endonuclease
MDMRVPPGSSYPRPRDFSSGPLHWSQYEAYVFGTLQRRMPAARIRRNVKLRGTKSGGRRQVDVLVEINVGEINLKIAVDCKWYGRKVNVNDVEQFLGMLGDIRVSKGILMTTKGYSKTALRRAQNEPRDIDLQILAVEQLSEFQCIGFAMPWKDSVGAVVKVPRTWVIDNEQTLLEGSADDPSIPQFTMYPLGHTRRSALAHRAFIYGGVILKWPGQTIDELATSHEQRVLEGCPSARFERLAPIARESREGDTGKNIFRVGRIHHGYRGPEYSLYIDHPEGVLILVMFCPDGQDDDYVPILKWVGERVQMISCVVEQLTPGMKAIT